MDYQLADGIAVLERTPAVLRAMLAGLPTQWIDATEGKVLAVLLDEFEALRVENLQTVRAWKLRDEQLVLVGEHPAFGAATLRQLLATWTAHDLGHIAQIARVMAKQYRDAVGPWREYLSVMNR